MVLSVFHVHYVVVVLSLPLRLYKYVGNYKSVTRVL